MLNKVHKARKGDRRFFLIIVSFVPFVTQPSAVEGISVKVAVPTPNLSWTAQGSAHKSDLGVGQASRRGRTYRPRATTSVKSSDCAGPL
jgi:hypothetical protein